MWHHAFHSNKELSHLANKGQNAKRGRKDIAKWICQPKGKQMKSGAPDLVSISCHTSATRTLQMSEKVNVKIKVKYLGLSV